jgi:hypothetical protein
MFVISLDASPGVNILRSEINGSQNLCQQGSGEAFAIRNYLIL